MEVNFNLLYGVKITWILIETYKNKNITEDSLSIIYKFVNLKILKFIKQKIIDKKYFNKIIKYIIYIFIIYNLQKKFN